ncbi:MAG: IS30 family transposase [Clostridia bacterium]|nr:IS30 family transposase [Clostridia bacterium]
MKKTNIGKHLTKEERVIIETGIRNGSTKSAIAETLGKEKSTIGKEIKEHRKLKFRTTLKRPCANYAHCKYKHACEMNCPGFVEFTCSRRDRSPGACNGCSNYTHCRFDKYYYDANKAQNEYEELRTESRLGISLTAEELKRISDTVVPLMENGQSPFHVLKTHPELDICEKTLYNYIDRQVFAFNPGPNIFHLRRKPGRRVSKKHQERENRLKKRQDRKYLQGRTYDDYLAFMEANPDLNVLQMDTVYNDETNGPFIQTFKFMKFNLLFALLHEKKTAQSMLDGVNLLESIIGPELFRKYVQVILTDRGSEFTYADEMEHGSDSMLRTRVFYCDPMASCQKGSLENNHELLRYICPKGTDLYELGLTSQDKLNLAISHVNSQITEKLEGKSPLTFTAFLSKELFQKLEAFGIKLIPEDEVVLKPYLLKDQK